MKLILFSDEEHKAECTIQAFTERGQLFRVLSFKSDQEINREKTSYAFGAIDDTGIKYWFFFGNPVCTDRKKALSIFLGLEAFCISENLGKAFAIKVKK